MSDTTPLLPTDPNCIFCKIVTGAIPCYQLYEDKQVLSFLDVGPLSRGHALIIPKGHWSTLDRLPIEVAAACMRVAPTLSRAIMAATGATAWNVLQNNGKAARQSVDHVHLHIIPRFDDSGLDMDWPAGKLAEMEAKELMKVIGAKMT